ncbi:hypothetical protein Celaphus_00009679 [Cervus elaphus hippelaphus]|uniref:Uncharacterized protein n=1 Tax=Cervus elaphus hippelaphus TaxID=46360 RepID=A0A212BZE1_CEREH|nr:hypothetical protein Celaphus_00009679 [Cervus elaphus hippelaphus]
MLSCKFHYRDSICRDCSVSPAVEGGREWFKIESEAHSGGVTRAADEDSGAMAFAVGTEHGGHRVPGGAASPCLSHRSHKWKSLASSCLEVLHCEGRFRSSSIQLTTEDPGLLQTSIAFCLEQLSLVIRILQHFVLPLFAKSQHRRGA